MTERVKNIKTLRAAFNGQPVGNRFDAALDALLAELEQAERERDDLREQKRSRGGMAQKIEELTLQNEECGNALVDAEARLAKVPALVEALREVSRGGEPLDGSEAVRLRDLAYEALTAWEQE